MQTKALSATTITGDQARNPDGQKLGHVEEIVIDLDSGRVSYAVLASGGFLGLGEKYFAVPWGLLNVDTDTHEVIIDVSKETLENAPGFDKDNWPNINDRSWVVDVYRYYGHEPFWDDEPIREDRAEESSSATAV